MAWLIKHNSGGNLFTLEMNLVLENNKVSRLRLGVESLRSAVSCNTSWEKIWGQVKSILVLDGGHWAQVR
jgi:hypothetical protein